MQDGNQSRADDRIVERERQPLDYSAASGATNPEHAAQDASTTMRTGRHAYTPNATFIADDVDAASDRWDTLNEANRRLTADSDDESRRSRQDTQDYVNDTQSWGRRIGLTTTEIEHAARLVTCADGGYMNNHGSEAVILAALTLAANQAPEHRPSQQKALRPGTVFSDQTPDLRDNYVDLRDDLGVDSESVRSCRQHLRQFC